MTKSNVCQPKNGDHHGVEKRAAKQMTVPMTLVNQCLQMIPVKLIGGSWNIL